MSTRLRLLATSALVVLAGCSGSSAVQPTGHPGNVPSAATTGVGLVQVGQRMLYAHCPPADGPTVVFLHGAGGRGSDWAAAAAQITGVRTCWYDRFNVGMSGHDNKRHDPRESVADVHALLAEVGAHPPYVLVGHSFGGLLALMYAGTYPHEIAGIVLADATLPFETELDPPEQTKAVRAEVNALEPGLDFYAGYSEARRLQRTLPPAPIVYIFATRQTFPDSWAPGAYQHLLHAWITTIPNGQLVHCTCGHEIPREHPDVAVKQVHAVLDGMR